MKLKNIILLGYFSLIIYNSAYSQDKNISKFKYKISNIPLDVQKNMQKNTWQPGCPVPLKDLKYLSLTFYGFDHKSHIGKLIVNKELADEVIEIFKELYEKKFPIEKMQLMDDFKGNDDEAMSENNTSAFNCRPVTGKPGVFSLHSYGRAIDINTKLNPYIKGNVILPKNGRPYADRTKRIPGKIILGDPIYKLFTEKGWVWGGSWVSLKDYQHFEKPESKK